MNRAALSESVTSMETPMVEGSEMKACPFCGGEPHIADNTGPKLSCNAHAFVRCCECHTDGPEGDTVAEAIERWNTRTGATR